ncbi:LptF/LptG family permease [bacterium]|nr:LptF/LptG family permease [bacterium]MBU1024440.1 LptF/LptG family permease [bacterium]
MREIGIFVLVGILGFTILIIGNNFYMLSDLIFQKKVLFSDLLLITLLDTPASMVLSLPVATLFGVMLSVGRLAMDSELVAMRTGGISLSRILIPLIVISLVFSAATYYLGEKLVPVASKTSEMIKEEKIQGKQFHLKNNIFFKRSDDFIIAVNKFNVKQNQLTRPVIWHRDGDEIHIYIAHTGVFENDDVVLHDANHHVFDATDQYRPLIRTEKIKVLRLNFPKELQKVHEETTGASGLAASDLKGQIGNLEQSGLDSSVAKTNLAFKYSTPIACTIFSFVAFMFSVMNPRKERYSGVFIALVLIFVYYILQTIFKSLGEKGVVRPPELAAWATNLLFLIVGMTAFIKTAK